MNRIWLVLIVVLLSACMTVDAGELPAARNAPEDAIFTWARGQPEKVENSLAVLQVVELDAQRAPVLISFRPEGWIGPLPALALFEVERRNALWQWRGLDYAAAPPLDGLLLSFHNHRPQTEPLWSAAYGHILDERVAQVTVAWSDGVQEAARVKNGTYLSLRPDSATARATYIAPLDAAGRVLAEYTPTSDQ